MSKDQPLRVQFTEKGVVHAGEYGIFGGEHKTIWGERDENGRLKTKKMPQRKGIRIACSWKEVPLSAEVSNRKTITCKNCMKKMGMVEGPVFPDRWVIRRKDTGEFLKNTSSRCTAWSEHVIDAWFWKRKGDAKKRCKTGRWVDNQGRPHKLQKYEDGKGLYEYEWIVDPNLEIKRVKVTLED